MKGREGRHGRRELYMRNDKLRHAGSKRRRDRRRLRCERAVSPAAVATGIARGAATCEASHVRIWKGDSTKWAGGNHLTADRSNQVVSEDDYSTRVERLIARRIRMSEGGLPSPETGQKAAPHLPRPPVFAHTWQPDREVKENPHIHAHERKGEDHRFSIDPAVVYH